MKGGLILLVLSRECGNKPGNSLKGNRKGLFLGFIPSSPPSTSKLRAAFDATAACFTSNEEKLCAQNTASNILGSESGVLPRSLAAI